MKKADWARFRDMVGEADGGDLLRMSGYIQVRWDYLDVVAARRFSIGDPVTFESKGVALSGAVKEIGRKTVLVEMDSLGPPWRVAAARAKLVEVKE